jgi:protein-S-isoprenylcysteine O-methyltransferase Ste14
VNRVFEIVFLLGFVIYVTIRGIYIQHAKQAVVVHRESARADRFLMFLVFLGNLLFPIVYFASGLLDFANYQLPPWAAWAGLAVMFMALWLFWRSHDDLGRNWSASLELHQQHELVTSGVYRFIRHPMYAAIMLFGLSQGLLLQNWFAGWSGLLTFLIMYWTRVRREEQMMMNRFGDGYCAYMQRTGRLIPKFWI